MLHPWPDWPVEGPRTAPDNLKELCRGGQSPAMSFQKFKSELLSSVKGGDIQSIASHPLLDELEFVCDVLDIGMWWDQVAWQNTAAGELLLRRKQQIRFAFANNKMKPVLEHRSLFMGLNRLKDTGVSTSLMNHLSDSLKDEQKLLKERRLAKEESSKR